MGFKPKYYPYPVLAPFTADYVTAVFEPKIDVAAATDPANLALSIDIAQLPGSIEAAVTSSQAEIVVDVDCPATLYRRLIPITGGVATLARGNLMGEFSVTPLVLLKSDLAFSPVAGDEVDPVYGGVSAFNLRAGDPLAIGDSQSFSASFNSRRDKSLLKLVKDPNRKSNLFSIDTSGEFLRILVSVPSYVAYSSLYNSAEKRPAFIIGVVKDAIFMGITDMAAQGEGSETWDLPWARALRDRFTDDQYSRLLEGGDFSDFDYAFAHHVSQEIVQRDGIDQLLAEGE